MGRAESRGEREAVRPLISPDDPGDALTEYYALYHPPALTRVHLHRSTQGAIDGFLAVCTTGADLFRPLVVMRAETDAVGRELIRESLIAGRPYHFVVPLRYRSLLEEALSASEERVGLILAVDPAEFRPVINVLVVQTAGASGGKRFEIRSQGRVVAAAGTNWQSPHFGEVYVYVEPEARGRGWGRSVASACTAALLADGVRALYVAAEGDEASLDLAASLGYRDTGRREFICQGVRVR